MLNLYKFYWDCGRSGDVQGRFLATEEDVEKIIGKDIYFGDILGKHSDVGGTVRTNDITLVTDNQEFINMANELGIELDSGYNPFDYYEESEEDEEEE